jgi:hypothetical protein
MPSHILSSTASFSQRPTSKADSEVLVQGAARRMHEIERLDRIKYAVIEVSRSGNGLLLATTRANLCSS